MAESTIVAHPYAHAAFSYANEQGELASWQGFLRLAAQVVMQPDVVKLLSHPVVSQQQVVTPMLEAMQEMLDEHQSNFLKLLAANGRLTLLPQIAHMFGQDLLAEQKTVHANVTTADQVSQSVLDSITAALAHYFDKNIELEHHIDANIIGGAVIRVGDKVIDASLKGSLQRLTTHMVQ